MILSAVMGIGLVSYGVAEPISHLATPPHGLAEAGSPEAAVRALQYSYFDWGLHAWAIFAVFGLAIAYSTYRKGRTTLVSQMFEPLLGDRVNGPIGKVIDVLAVFATLFGTTTSLGLGALQINNGLGSLFGVPVNNVTQVLIIAAVTAVFTMSAVTGVSKGIKFLSQASTAMAIALFVFILIVGPTVFIANLYIESLGMWATDFFRMSLQGTAFGGLEWMQWWTYFMMAWWVSWGAFVGVFLARISGAAPSAASSWACCSCRRVLHLVHRVRWHRHPHRHVRGRRHRQADGRRHQQRVLRHPGPLPVCHRDLRDRDHPRPDVLHLGRGRQHLRA